MVYSLNMLLCAKKFLHNIESKKSDEIYGFRDKRN